MIEKLSLNLFLNEFQDCNFYLVHKNSKKQFMDGISLNSRIYEIDILKFLNSLTDSSREEIAHVDTSNFSVFVDPVSFKQPARITGGIPL